MLISLIVPSYNEEEAMPLFYKEAARVAAGMERSHGAEFEFIFVDDGSKDKTLQVARRLHDYEKFGYRNLGVSASVHGGAVWYDMILEFDRTEASGPAANTCGE